MKSKFCGVGIVLIILISLIVWKLGGGTALLTGSSKEAEADIAPKPQPERHESSMGHEKSNPSYQSKPDRIAVMRGLEDIARISPRLIERFSLQLFDDNLNPNTDEWKMLGVDNKAAENLSSDLKSIFEGVRKKEAGSFSILDQSKDQIRIAIPRSSHEDAAAQLEQIGSSFSKVFGDPLSDLMMRQFIEKHLSIAGGIDGRDRIVTITSTSNDVVSRLGRRYEIRTQVLFKGTTLSEALGNLENYSQDNGIELVESVPESWSHLFGGSN